MSYIFSKENFSYVSGNGNPQKIQEVTFWVQKIKKTILKKYLIFQKIELFSSKRKERTCKAWKSKIAYFFFAERELFKYKHKRKTFLILSLIKKQSFLN